MLCDPQNSSPLRAQGGASNAVTAPALAIEPVPGIDHQKGPFEIRESVCRICGNITIEDLRDILLARKADELFIDHAAVKDISQLVLLAQRIHAAAVSLAPITEPVIVGLLAPEEITTEVGNSLATHLIRTTGRTYDVYCVHVKEHREWVATFPGRSGAALSESQAE